jgi:hypothetical protein
VLGVRGDLLELLEQLALAGRELLRHLDEDAVARVATATALEHRHPFPTEPQHVAVLGARGHLELRDAAEDGYVDLGPEGGLDEREGEPAMEVVAVSLEELVGPEVQDDVEIAWAPSSTPGGILTLSVRSRATRPFPAHSLHGFRFTWPSPPHWGQVRATVRKPCW